ncbi:MotA/TolQ/ExbB proton channel family protein [Candidatus Kapabacteria bacterium]|nr:MotA/TolQ/ExbB proton channel family protein [Candidatus Kapabacteria bacterium]
MKNMFNMIVLIGSFAASYLFWEFVMGDPSGFADPLVRHEPNPENLLAVIYTGGPIVSILITCILVSLTFSLERLWSINKMKGNSNPEKFIKDVITDLTKDDLDSAIAKCDKQRGSVANVLRTSIERFKEVENDAEYTSEKKISEVQRAIDESMNLETPLLEKNLVMISTVASVAVLFGLLGTTVGMIRAFRALASSGTVSAQQLSLGISEALYNTAGGLIGAILSILAYNYFTTKVDNFVYMIDEAILSVTQIFTGRIKK